MRPSSVDECGAINDKYSAVIIGAVGSNTFLCSFLPLAHVLVMRVRGMTHTCLNHSCHDSGSCFRVDSDIDSVASGGQYPGRREADENWSMGVYVCVRHTEPHSDGVIMQHMEGGCHA